MICRRSGGDFEASRRATPVQTKQLQQEKRKNNNLLYEQKNKLKRIFIEIERRKTQRCSKITKDEA